MTAAERPDPITDLSQVPAEDLATWLTGCLDQTARIAKGEVDNDEDSGWHTVGCGWNIGEFSLTCTCWGPEKTLARVEAERALLREHRPRGPRADDGCARCFHSADWTGGDDYRDYPCETVRWLAYAHRFDAAGWRVEWAPDGVQIPQ